MTRIFVVSVLLLLPAVATAKIRRRGPLPSQLPTATVPKLLSRAPGKSVKIGTWVKYKVTDKKRKGTFNLRIAFVGREKGGQQTWIEVTLANGAQVQHIKLLFEGKPGKNMGKAKKMILKMGSMHAMEVPVSNKDKMLPVLFRPPMVKPKKVGVMDVRTPAGLFPGATKIRGVDADGGVIELLNHPNVRLWGLLSFRTKTLKMELIGQGLAPEAA